MSRENVEVVRQQVTVPQLAGRSLAVRLAIPLQALTARATRRILRLPPAHRLRRAVVSWGVRHGFAGLNRRDHAASMMLWAEDVETIWPREALALGFDRTSRGRAERFLAQRQWEADLGDHEQKDVEVIDLGDRLVLLARIVGTGRASGAAFQNEVGYVLSLSHGRVVREEIFFSHSEALEAVGPRE